MYLNYIDFYFYNRIQLDTYTLFIAKITVKFNKHNANYSIESVGIGAGLAATVTIFLDKVSSLIIIYSPVPIIKILPK